MNIRIYIENNDESNGLKIGATYYKDAMDEYIKRLSRFTKVELLNYRQNDCDDIDFNLVFSVTGEDSDSPSLSNKIKDIMNSFSTINILIKGKSNFKKYNNEVKLTTLSLDTSLEIVMALEQIYRAFKIMNNETYHK